MRGEKALIIYDKDMIHIPKITVFMAVFNSSAYLKGAIESILDQTFENFELLIVNDGSTDNSLEIIQAFRDERIRILNNEKNMGLEYTRNRGIEEARGKYMAILDSDDIAIRDRLKIQFDYLESKPDVAVCGGHAIFIDEQENELSTCLVPLGDKDLQMRMLFRNPMVNSTAMIRLDVIREVNGYRDFPVCQDFDLLLRIAENHNIANIDCILGKYRINPRGVSKTRRHDVVNAEKRLIKEMHERLKIEANQELIEIHYALYSNNINEFNLSQFRLLLEKLKSANKAILKYEESDFNEILYDKWYNIIRTKGKKSALYYYFNTSLFYWPAVKFKHLRKIFKQSIGIN